MQPFVFTRNYREIVCDEDGLEGLTVRVRGGISNDEQMALREAWADLLKYSVWYQNLGPAETEEVNASGDTPRRREWLLLAPYIIGWNACAETADGTEAPLPPPAEAGPDVFACVPMDAVGWMLGAVIGGYRTTGKAGSLPAGLRPTFGPQIVPAAAASTPSAKTSRRPRN